MAKIKPARATKKYIRWFAELIPGDQFRRCNANGSEIIDEVRHVWVDRDGVYEVCGCSGLYYTRMGDDVAAWLDNKGTFAATIRPLPRKRAASTGGKGKK